MKYLCLVYRDTPPADVPDTARAGPPVDAAARRDELVRGGQLLAVGTLEPARAVAAVRVRDGELVVSAGPCDAAAHPDAFALIEARDLNDAIRLAARLPASGAEYVEVRPVRASPAP